MARAPIPFVVIKSAGDIVVGASAQVNLRGAGAATVYAAESGGTVVTNPITTDVSGKITGWLDEGSYDIVVSGAGITTHTRGFDILKGGGTFALADLSVTTVKIVDANVTNAKLAANAVTTPIIVNSAVTVDKLTTADATILGLTGGGVTRRGKNSVVAGTFSTSNASFQTADQITGITLPTDGLIAVVYQANWNYTVASDGQAAIHLDGNQLKMAAGSNTVPILQQAQAGTTINNWTPLCTTQRGLVSGTAAANYTGDVTTGQVLGSNFVGHGPSFIFAAAGSHDISVKIKSISGTSTVSVRGRRFWVWTVGF